MEERRGEKRSGKCGNQMVYKVVKRSFDLIATVILLLVLIVPMIIIALLVKATSKGPFLYWSGLQFLVLSFEFLVKKGTCEADI